MKSEEEVLVETVLVKNASSLEKKKSLKRMGELLEESYILNLPPDRKLIDGLAKISTSAKMDSITRNKAKHLLKQYRLS